jgi:hypothetical protein
MSLKKQYQGINTILQLKERKEALIHLKLVQHTLDSGLADLEMALEFRYGQMVLDMKVKL